MQMFIEVWSDIVCPFCYIGKRNLEHALKEFDSPVQVVYRSFELDKEAPRTTELNLPEHLAKKYGKPLEWAIAMNQQVTGRAASVGLNFHLDKAIRTNSFDAHRLIHLAETMGRQDEMKERLPLAYFTEGKDIGDAETLVSLGVETGLDAHAIRVMLETDQFKDEVRQDERIATDLEISGVPFFVINQRFAISGAQPKEYFIEALNKAKSHLELEKGES